MANHISFDDALDRLCVLEDPARRTVYVAVRAARQSVTRAEVAEAAGISVRLAAFHLEKLLAEGFLEASFHDGGRVGHPAKRYRPSDLELEVSLPPRRYDLVAQMLADVLTDRPEAPATELEEVAEAYGRRIGSRVRSRRGERRFLTALRFVGYEPATTNGDIVLRNCPFRRAAERSPEVVCRMNHAFVEGLLAGTRTSSRGAKLDPAPGRCCVVVTPDSGRRETPRSLAPIGASRDREPAAQDPLPQISPTTTVEIARHFTYPGEPRPWCGCWVPFERLEVVSMSDESLYDRLGGVFAIAAVVDHFSDAVVENPIVGKTSKNPGLRDWHTNELGRLPGLKFMRTLWVCAVAGGPFQYTATKPGATDVGLEEAHRELEISPDEFDEVAAELGRTLDFFKVPAQEKEEVLAAFAAHKGEVTTGYVAATT